MPRRNRDTKKEDSLYKEIQELNGWVNDLVEAKEYFLEQIRVKDEKNAELEEKLNDIYCSKRWKYVNRIGNAFNKLKGSKK